MRPDRVRLLFVAGTGTDVGKTYVTTALIASLRAQGRRVEAVKPVLSGAPAWDDPGFATSDTGRLLTAQGRPLDRAAVEACSPWRYRAPLAPDMAARREGRSLTLAELVAFHDRLACAQPEDATLLVEGVGGLMSPVAVDATGLDWAKAIGAPVLLVAGGYLGAISHALTACAAIAHDGVALAAIVVNAGAEGGLSAPLPVPLEETADAIAARSGARVSVLAHGAGFSATLHGL